MTTTQQPGELVDTRDMVCVHVFLRREFRLAGDVIRAAAAGDTRRAGVVAGHLDFLATFLHHHHHTAEDRLLWPKLLHRVPDELAPIVHLMETQHTHIDALHQQIPPLLSRWRAQAHDADRDELARLFDKLHACLVEHLDAEEQQLLPLAARTVSLAEWQQLGKEGAKSMRMADIPLVFGMFGYEGDPEVYARMVRETPWVIQLVVNRFAQRSFRKHALAIHGTPTP